MVTPKRDFNGLYLKNTQRAINFLESEGYPYGYLNGNDKYIIVYRNSFNTSNVTKDSRGIFTRFRDKVSNGCGGKGGWIKPPDFLFHASCDKHDELYTIGGTEEDRKADDDKFYELMISDTNISGGFDKYYFRLWAYIYYKAVRLYGKKYFNYVV